MYVFETQQDVSMSVASRRAYNSATVSSNTCLKFNKQRNSTLMCRCPSLRLTNIIFVVTFVLLANSLGSCQLYSNESTFFKSIQHMIEICHVFWDQGSESNFEHIRTQQFLQNTVLHFCCNLQFFCKKSFCKKCLIFTKLYRFTLNK